MKLILSRKGFDASIGQVPSPILAPQRALYSLPIPERSPHPITRYQDISAGQHSIGAIVNDLTRGKISPAAGAHLDPDLNYLSTPRLPGWKPIFGQAGAAEKHLQDQQVTAGDMFLFYGWFREAECVNGTYRYRPGAPDLHVIFGWLQIEQRICVDDLTSIPSWAHSHPHCKREKYHKLDSIYIAKDRIDVPGLALDRPGAGIYTRFHPALQLTAHGRSRSTWRLPHWLYPYNEKPSLTYHRDPTRWVLADDHVLLQTVGRGQEFVLDCRAYPEAIEWLARLLSL